MKAKHTFPKMREYRFNVSHETDKKVDLLLAKIFIKTEVQIKKNELKRELIEKGVETMEKELEKNKYGQ